MAENKHTILQSLKFGILALVALPLLALQSAAAADTPPEGDNAVMCAKCKTVWVSRPAVAGSAKSGVVVYRKAKSME